MLSRIYHSLTMIGHNCASSAFKSSLNRPWAVAAFPVSADAPTRCYAQKNEQEVLVVGSGVIGLTSAVRILREVPSSKVTVVGHQMGWNTTTAGAAGLWGPYRIWDTPDDLVTRWSGVTLDHLYDLLHSEDAARAGISLRGVHWFKEEPFPTPSWSTVVDSWGPVSPRILSLVNSRRKHGRPFVQGWFYHSIACEGGPYLEWLHSQIVSLGGQILATPAPLTSLTDVYNEDVQRSWSMAPPPGSRLHTGYAPATPQPGSGSSIIGQTLQEYLGTSSSSPAEIPQAQHAAQHAQHESAQQGLDIPRNWDLVVNCTGIGAGKLLNDLNVSPIRGQILRVSAPWVTTAYLADTNYIIPNNNSIVLGGTAQVGDWNTEPSEDDRKHIVSGCLDVLPSLAEARILQDWVGLRPGRTAVRLELDQLQVPITSSPTSTTTVPLIHNYGHGGSGLTLAWGCAADVVDLVKKATSAVKA